MKNILYNMGYFLRESYTIMHVNLLSNIFSILSTGLIFFILFIMITGWWISSQALEAIQGEAEINVYYKEGASNADVQKLISSIEEVDGVKEATLVDKTEAYRRMEEILAQEARVLEYLDSNPFNPFIEIKIDIDKTDSVLNQLRNIKLIEHIRDNQEVLKKLQDISKVLHILGYLVAVAAFISTGVIISHIIRLGIYNSREQINTLRLLGAPEGFIAFPFLLSGLGITIAGGILAEILSINSIGWLYQQITAPLPFIPLPSKNVLVSNLSTLLIFLSVILGIIGSVFGLITAKSR